MILTNHIFFSYNIYRAKSAAERNNPEYSKYIVLNRSHFAAIDGTKKATGEMKGFFKSIENHGTIITVHLDTEETLELKVCFLFNFILNV